MTSRFLSSLVIATSLLAMPRLMHAQAPPASDPTAAPRTGAAPGVLQRPTVAPEEEEPEVSAEEQERLDAAEAAEREAAAAERNPGGDSAVRPPADRGTDRDRADRPSRPERPASRTPVLDVEDIEPDIGNIDDNFEEGFDPINLPSNVRVNIDFREAELNDVVMWISALTGRNFIIADTINASKKITIISPQPVSVAEAYRAFIAALNMNGLTVVPFGRFLRIVEASGAERQVLEPSHVAAKSRLMTGW